MSESKRTEGAEFTTQDGSSANVRLATRRAALRRLGITTGAALFGMLAGDDLVRAVAAGVQRSHSNSALADFVVKAFRDSGVALASRGDSVCGVPIVACEVGGPCRACNTEVNCNDCQSVADFAFCECQQAADNMWPGCCDENGNPNGDPGCAAYNAAIAACNLQYGYATSSC